MVEDRVFRNALIISAIFHLFIFYNWPVLKNLPILKTHDKIEVAYYSFTKKAPPISDLIGKQQKLGKAVPSPTKTQSAPAKAEGLPKLKRVEAEPEKPTFKISAAEKASLIKVIPSEEKMLISHQAKDFTEEPTYLNYHNAVRSKIYRIATTNKPHYFTEGEVRLIFAIARDGNLLKVEIIPEGSTQNAVLRSHALASIKKAAPFPPFHESMREDHLTLRLTISFEK